MANGFIDELRWRGLLQDSMPGAEEHLAKAAQRGYIGFDPTADSLHVGNLVQIMLLVHFQRAGHKPVALVGGATGMVGDPSGKSEERQLLTKEILDHNVACIRAQLEHFLDFKAAENPAELVNNYDWFKDMGFLQFIRDVGKHITVNYMMAKDSVKNRLETGLSFTEFSYQLVQGYDYYWLYKHMGCSVQMGGSDQWGNITTGSELIRRMDGGEAFAITSPLLTKADGSKFGKSEGGNIWLDPKRTSPYKFYQFWLNASDDEADRFIRIFTTFTQKEVEALVADHANAPNLRILQKSLAAEITRRTHGDETALKCEADSVIIFDGIKRGNFSVWGVEIWKEAAGSLPFSQMTDGLGKPWPVIDLVSGAFARIYDSRGEAKRAVQAGSLYINGIRATELTVINIDDFFHGRYLMVSKGKKNHYVIILGED